MYYRAGLNSDWSPHCFRRNFPDCRLAGDGALLPEGGIPAFPPRSGANGAGVGWPHEDDRFVAVSGNLADIAARNDEICITSASALACSDASAGS